MENGHTKEQIQEESPLQLGSEFIKEPHDDQVVTVDSLLENVGGCGRFQVGLEVILCLMTFALFYQNLITYFVGHSPNWRCSTFGDNSTLQDCNIIGDVDSSNVTLYNSRCLMDRRSWEYTTEKDYSYITEYDLICNASAFGTLANTAFYIGWGIGAIPLGVVSDYIGRKPVFFASFFIVLASSIGLSFASGFGSIFSLRVITGIGQSGYSLTSYVLASENVGVKYRAATGNALFIVGVLSFMVLDLQAYFMRSWRTLVLLCSAPYVGLLFFYLYVPESLRWLAAKKKIDEAERILQRMARTNKKPVNQCSALLPKLTQQQGAAKGSVIDILRHRVLFLRSMNQGLGWFVCGMTYYGISLASADLTGSMYRDFALTSIVEIPSIFMVISGVERFGRKKTIPISLCLSGVLCASVALVPEKSNYPVLPFLRISFGMLGKLFNSVAFNGFYVWSTELYPTVIRTQGLSFVFFMARIGASSAPYVANGLKLIHPAIPFILMGASSFVSGLFTSLLPETRGRSMPETIADTLKDGTLRSPVEEAILMSSVKDASVINDDSEDDVYDEKATLL